MHWEREGSVDGLYPQLPSQTVFAVLCLQSTCTHLVVYYRGRQMPLRVRSWHCASRYSSWLSSGAFKHDSCTMSVLEDRAESTGYIAALCHDRLSALVLAGPGQPHDADWNEYAAILLDGETAAFLAARLAGNSATDCDDSNPPPNKKKRKPVAVGVSGHPASDAAVPDVSLRVACLDGTTLDVTVPQPGLVREVKRIVGQVCVCVCMCVRVCARACVCVCATCMWEVVPYEIAPEGGGGLCDPLCPSCCASHETRTRA
jgi:hypothetical protein